MARQEAAMIIRIILSLIAMSALALDGPLPSAHAADLDSQAVLRSLEDAFVSVADHVTPSVVNVSVKPKRNPSESGAPERQEQFREFFGPELFERFFRQRQPREDTRATGSGVIVDATGYILTNHHVVESAGSVEVRLSDDRKFAATVVGRDPKTDLAVLKIEAAGSPLPVATLGDSDKLRAGQWAIAIGNPFGLDRTVTIGHISATGRTHVGVATYEAFIQTDASINPGNSGGPLLNIEGKVIGINTAVVSSGQGIGFSIPINMAREIMTQLISKGKVVRGWLGIVIQELTPELAESFGVKPDGGVLVADVMRDGPAEAAGLKAGDVIVEFDGAAIRDVTDLQRRVANVEPGRPAKLVVIRDKASTPLTVKIGEQPGEETAATVQPKEETLGLSVESLTPEAADQLKLTAKPGVVVTDVAPGSSGDQAGIRPGDAILEVNRQPIKDVDGFRRAIASAKPGDAVPVYLQRGGGRNEYVVLSIPDNR
jgi:Do/DeqQ family serine protease